MTEEASGAGEIEKRCSDWFSLFRFWKGLSWTLSVLIGGLSAFVASSLSLGQGGREYAALTVAVCAAVQAALRPEQRANAYREAWIELDLALKRERKVPGQLLEALRRGENRIGETHAEGHAPKRQVQIDTTRD